MSVIINENLNASKRKSDETESSQLAPELGEVKAVPKRTKTDSSKNTLNSIPLRRAIPGEVYMVGTGDASQLGMTDDVFELKKPKLLKSLPNNIVDIVCGGMHTLALTQDGKLYSWGCNDEKALGRAGDESVPAIVEFPETIDIVQIVASDSMSAALTSKGQVYAWGGIRNNNGLMGFYKMHKQLQETPKLIQDSMLKDPVAHLATSSNNLFMVTTKGSVFSFGDDTCGLLGVRKASSRSSKSGATQGLSLNCLPLSNVTSVFAGGYHAFALKANGKVVSWGQNNFYQCGQPSLFDNDYTINIPTESASVSALNVQSISAGEHHSIILSKDNKLYGLGRADAGQLGFGESNDNVVNEGTKSAAETPIQVNVPGQISQISSGSVHNFAVSSGLYAWGFGEQFALGTGSDDQINSPKLIEAFSQRKVILAAAGAQHSAFLVRSS